MKRAFTLIEMMIVIAIISTLITAAVPIYQKVIFKSRANEAKAMIQAIAFAQERYHQENGDYYPPINVNAVSIVSIKNEENIFNEIKVDLSKSNNFNYFITKEIDGNYTIKAVLRIGDNICDNNISSAICKKNNTAKMDDWVDNYTRGQDKHYLEFRYPVKLTGDYVEAGISYEHLYTGD